MVRGHGFGTEVTAMKLRKLILAAGVMAALFTGLGDLAVQSVQAAPANPTAAGGSGGSPPRASTAAPPTIYVQSCTGGSFCQLTGAKPGHAYSPFIEEWNGKARR